MKVFVPNSLRQAIQDSLASMDSDLQADAIQRSELADKISEYERQRCQLVEKIDLLKGRILTDGDAAAQIPALQLRLEALGAALSVLHGQLEALPPVTLAPAVAVLLQVIQHWRVAFPEAFADQVRDCFLNRQNALNAANLADARRVLAPLTTRCNDYLRVASPANVEFLRFVFGRALEGQPHLGLAVESSTEAA